MMKVREMVLSMSMPISAAVGASSATARMLRPSLVAFTSRSRKTIITTRGDDDDHCDQERDLGAADREQHGGSG